MSLRHAALVTHRGEMYTWGHGTGAKLGLGNHQNADSPQRVYTLWGKSVKRVSCGGHFSTTIAYRQTHINAVQSPLALTLLMAV